jgi:imidazolonepropionase-like amidohydrolase
MDQFTDAEIQAAVDEAATRRTYVMAHAHTARAVIRCVQHGVRSIEHGTLMDRESADIVAASSSFVVPTLSIVDALRDGTVSLPTEARHKLEFIRDQNSISLQLCVAAGVKLGFGTDLFGPIRDRQSLEFTSRGRLQPAIDVLRSATSINAELLGRKGALGTVAPGACADLIAVDGDPTSSLEIMANPDLHLRLIVQDGRVILNRMERTSP